MKQAETTLAAARATGKTAPTTRNVCPACGGRLMKHPVYGKLQSFAWCARCRLDAGAAEDRIAAQDDATDLLRWARAAARRADDLAHALPSGDPAQEEADRLAANVRLLEIGCDALRSAASPRWFRRWSRDATGRP